jgi:osmoprotectant transport system substrate-binding protein
MRRRVHGVLACCLLPFLVAIAACSDAGPHRSETALGDSSVTVGSFDFPESELLAELYSQSLEAHGIDVQRRFSLGPRELVAPALLQGLVELIPEYAGTAVQYHGVASDQLTPDPESTHEHLVAALAGTDVRAMRASSAQDANTFVVTRATAERYGLQAISDLERVAPRMTLAGPPECPRRAFCLAGLRDRYGLRFRDFAALDAGGPLTRQALLDGVVDVALFFSSDPTLQDDDLVQLADDRFLQPAENVTPLVRREVLRSWDDRVPAAVDAVSDALDRDTLRDLNGEVARGEPVRRVARQWLAAQGLR